MTDSDSTDAAPIDPGAAEAQAQAFQATAQVVDQIFERTIAAALERDADPLAVLSGVVTAATRLAITHGMAADEPKTVRNVLTVMIKAANQAAEALLQPQTTKQ